MWPISGGVMEPPEARRRGVIYVTVSMTFAVRALSVFLTVWLTAAAAFPPCCWSMTYAHEHQETPDGSRSDAAAAEHHHHGSADSVAPSGTTSVLSSVPAYDCDTESVDAATITSAARPPADARLAGDSAVDVVAPPVSARMFARADLSPPGTSSSAAFLSPLRI